MTAEYTCRHCGGYSAKGSGCCKSCINTTRNKDPTPEEIVERCAIVRLDWTEEVRLKRLMRWDLDGELDLGY
jgi:predicted ATP-dependent serine protease